MRWSNAGSHEVVSMLGLSTRVGTTTERSPASLVPLSVTMDGLHVLQLVPKRFWPCKPVHVANVGEYLCSIGHYRLNEGI